MAGKQRHFPYQHPTFGRKTNPKPSSAWQRSVYYWWFEYLRRHEGYALTCKRGGKGKFSKLYAEFGDVHEADFKTWWTTDNRGVELFAEPKSVSELQLVQLDDLQGIAPDPIVAYVQVPLNLPKRFLKQEFAKLLLKHHQGQRGVRHARSSNARYPVHGQPNMPALRVTLQVYDLKKAEPELKLWQIGERLRLFQFAQIAADGDTPLTIANKRNIMAATVSRYLRKAQAMIDNVAVGIFPKPTKAK
jgi:hypothetical protein